MHMQRTITTLALVALLTSGSAALAADNHEKSFLAGAAEIELGSRLSANIQTSSGVQPSSETLNPVATTAEPPRERKVRIVYPLPR